VRPDANGCTPDLDGDGVDEAHDSCPDSPAGVPVDANGCPPAPEPPPQESLQAPQAAADADHDGVPDGEDACPHTPAGLEVDEKGCVRPENVTLRNVHFDLESARLTADGYVLLRQVAAAMKAEPALRLEVSGHADSTGSNRYNEKLSVRRAETVHNFLNYLGIPQARMVLKAYGETKPVADNQTDEGRASNRRVDFRRLNP
jgi:OOP family OmpA-OmpF porin